MRAEQTCKRSQNMSSSLLSSQDSGAPVHSSCLTVPKRGCYRGNATFLRYLLDAEFVESH